MSHKSVSSKDKLSFMDSNGSGLSDKQVKRHYQMIQNDQKRLLYELPLCNLGNERMSKHINPDVVVGQFKKRTIHRTKAEHKEHVLLK